MVEKISELKKCWENFRIVKIINLKIKKNSECENNRMLRKLQKKTDDQEISEKHGENFRT